MKYKYTMLGALLFGVVMGILFTTVFSSSLGTASMSVGVCLGAAFACCGGLFGHAIDKKNDKNK